MSEIRIQNIPQTWDDTRDVAFFTITNGIFATDFVYGAGVLLGTYDDELDTVAATADSALDAPAATTSTVGSAVSHIAQ